MISSYAHTIGIQMKYNILKIFCYLFFIFIPLIITCTQDTKNNTTVQEIIARGSSFIPLESSDFLQLDQAYSTMLQSTDNNFSSLLSLLPSGYVLLDYVFTNINTDDIDEYILLYATHSDPQVKMLIAAIDTTFQKYNFIWQSNTQAYGMSGMNLEVKDITGDFFKELIVLGSDASKNRTIDVFKMQNNDILSYNNIFSKFATGIDILEKNFQQYTDEVSITTFTQIVVYDISKDNETTREYYQWNQASNVFQIISSEHFTYSDIIREKLSLLREANDEALMNFLQGAWDRESGSIQLQQEFEQLYLIISTRIKQVVFYEKDEAYVYDWRSSFRSIPSRGGIAFQVNLTSNILPSVYDWMHVEIVTDDTIYVTVNENLPSKIVGKYKKINQENFLSETLTYNNNSNSNRIETDILLTKLSGIFENTTNNNMYVFDYPKLQILNEEINETVYYNIFDIDNNTVIEIKYKEKKPTFYFIDTQNFDKGILNLIPMDIFADSYYLRKNRKNIELVSKKEE